MFYVSIMVTKKKTPKEDTQKKNRKESNHINTNQSANHKGRWQERKGGTK